MKYGIAITILILVIASIGNADVVIVPRSFSVLAKVEVCWGINLIKTFPCKTFEAMMKDRIVNLPDGRVLLLRCSGSSATLYLIHPAGLPYRQPLENVRIAPRVAKAKSIWTRSIGTWK